MRCKAVLLMDHSTSFISAKNKSLKVIVMFIAALMTFLVMTEGFSADAAAAKLSTPKMTAQINYGSEFTHPYNKQTNTIKNTNCTVTGLQRTTSYQFRVKAVNGSAASAYSKTQTIKTARMDFNKAGWEAMCRIVYHEVGKMSGSEWDKPIVYVADCVANQYVAAKYTKNAMWRSYYARYNNVQDIIYRSGGFMSSAQLSRDGANYSNVSRRVKQAVFGAVYGKTHLNGIANDYNVYFWCNRSYKTNSSKIAYSFKIPWGYFNVWRTYWG